MGGDRRINVIAVIAAVMFAKFFAAILGGMGVMYTLILKGTAFFKDLPEELSLSRRKGSDASLTHEPREDSLAMKGDFLSKVTIGAIILIVIYLTSTNKFVHVSDRGSLSRSHALTATMIMRVIPRVKFKAGLH